MDTKTIIELLEKRGLLSQLEGKRIVTGTLPVTTTIRLMISEIGTGKSRTSNVSTAIATYLGRNEANHQLEVEAKAVIAGVSPEEYVADYIQKKLEAREGQDN